MRYEIFDTRVAGIPCQVQVMSYSAPLPLQVTGTGMGDADPPEHEEFDFCLLDTTGHPAPWLLDKLTEEDEERILQEYKSGDENE